MAKPKDNSLPARDRVMYNMRRDGHSLESIAQLFNVSRATAGRGVTRHTNKLAAEVYKRINKGR